MRLVKMGPLSSDERLSCHGWPGPLKGVSAVPSNVVHVMLMSTLFSTSPTPLEEVCHLHKSYEQASFRGNWRKN